jgi:hypothetical protein
MWIINRVRSSINLGRGFLRIDIALRSKSSPLGPINRLGELLPWNWQSEATKLAA